LVLKLDTYPGKNVGVAWCMLNNIAADVIGGFVSSVVNARDSYEMVIS
jgi:hypothetical protein